jgi:hypothetical protein
MYADHNFLTDDRTPTRSPHPRTSLSPPGPRASVAPPLGQALRARDRAGSCSGAGDRRPAARSAGRGPRRLAGRGPPERRRHTGTLLLAGRAARHERVTGAAAQRRQRGRGGVRPLQHLRRLARPQRLVGPRRGLARPCKGRVGLDESRWVGFAAPRRWLSRVWAPDTATRTAVHGRRPPPHRPRSPTDRTRTPRSRTRRTRRLHRATHRASASSRASSGWHAPARASSRGRIGRS